MNAPDTTLESQAPVEDGRNWWHRSHPTFAAITGFFSGMLFMTALPGGFAGVMRLMFDYATVEKYFPYLLVLLVVPIALLARKKTRRFAIFMIIGMVITSLVVAGVASLVLYLMVQQDG